MCSSAAADDICPLLGSYAASCGNFLPSFRDDLAMRCHETSARDYDYSLGDSPEESSSPVFRGGSLKSHTCGWVCRLFERLSFQLDPCQRGRVVMRMPEANREKGKPRVSAGSRSPVTQFVN